MTTSTWISIIATFAVIVFSTFGRKSFNGIRLLIPVGILGYFGATYLKDVPTGGNNGWLLAASILFGALIGVVLIGLASVERDDKGKTYVTTGIASVAVMAIVFILRIVLIEWVTHHLEKAYLYSVQHHFDLNLIAPAFVLMAIAMVVVRIGGVVVKVKRVKIGAELRDKRVLN
ncbi:hypothetical protein ACFRAM_06375 [Paenibacillus sp. NPDC056722]|uniref:hypothetical protein n=1 Tax=Paenibacillus sp. NPDC056722 TaxID=3345924 RepID=UPI0036BB3819